MIKLLRINIIRHADYFVHNFPGLRDVCGVKIIAHMFELVPSVREE